VVLRARAWGGPSSTPGSCSDCLPACQRVKSIVDVCCPRESCRIRRGVCHRAVTPLPPSPLLFPGAPPDPDEFCPRIAAGVVASGVPNYAGSVSQIISPPEANCSASNPHPTVGTRAYHPSRRHPPPTWSLGTDSGACASPRPRSWQVLPKRSRPDQPPPDHRRVTRGANPAATVSQTTPRRAVYAGPGAATQPVAVAGTPAGYRQWLPNPPRQYSRSRSPCKYCEPPDATTPARDDWATPSRVC